MKKLLLFLIVGIIGSLVFGSIVSAESRSEEVDVQVNDEDTELSEVLTFDEVVQKLAKDEDISIEKAEQRIIGSSSSTKLLQQSREAEIEARAASYRTITKEFRVNSIYKPSVKFYVRVNVPFGQFAEIEEILNVGMNRDDSGYSKKFNGTVYTNLEDKHTIHFIVNGDFYNYGTTVVDGGVSIGVGKAATVEFNISHASDHYEYVYTSDTFEYR
ncbi:hypothetical protein SAMN04487943_101281 [Gracilibacillus orientalis]|uniref:Uncharacterized protein n=1 Tax=Gracilibacillus orientalis TaxID=334253 RepID=A0A1I4H9Z8_9BACI|nr:hypothetical protein [Gracilibacillus orientalis]SFL38437.1 hypothetical protein SAMN04487943_101281 [Gracilibacillus orientalis]